MQYKYKGAGGGEKVGEMCVLTSEVTKLAAEGAVLEMNHSGGVVGSSVVEVEIAKVLETGDADAVSDAAGHDYHNSNTPSVAPPPHQATSIYPQSSDLASVPASNTGSGGCETSNEEPQVRTNTSTEQDGLPQDHVPLGAT